MESNNWALKTSLNFLIKFVDSSTNRILTLKLSQADGVECSKLGVPSLTPYTQELLPGRDQTRVPFDVTRKIFLLQE